MYQTHETSTTINSFFPMLPWKRVILTFLLLVSHVLADMDMGDDKVEFHPVNAGSKTFHWITSLVLLLLVPSAASVFAFAERYHWSGLLHVVSLAYSAFESLFLAFPDPSNHENRTSKGTSWFLTWELGGTVLLASFITGKNLFGREAPSTTAFSPSRAAVRLYKTVSFTTVLTGWVRVCMAPVALFGFCYGRSTGQCIAHGIMGSSFVGYGFLLAWVLAIPWIRNRRGNGRSQEFWDSSLMCLWGIVNTFTEHRWGREGWSHGDYQHTSMGIIWWCGGMLGMWLSRRENTRNVVPAVLLIYTGYAMSEHSQHLEISTKVHAMFGLVLMAGGLTRIMEICFLLRDAAACDTGRVLAFQHFPPLCLVMSGVLFMSANEEQLEMVHGLGADHSSYILVVCGAGFVIYLWMLMMLALYLHLVGYDEDGQLRGYADITGHEDFELDTVSETEE
ncbi:hypothetical protein EJF18_20660 [Clavispora lusitaniae]|uniref:Uncharacterized protein n=1 Tax=Clavispora lusitaniae TaxID=36911 RepID=A0ACD0WH11_CLALS|nr:hypothetical protein EJF14_20660 [Clavispora lusitaniae]QFZ32410.1 hypothetical protein EJF16_20660 [Clavispora lusitaniae]QFZ38079.1 hypothetical protein EJF15_20660 [Clavispora lusitaniae]QFZ43762.1 hypothetical protein EJF18_20660 [Clavispora lusitaniae]QFZ49439.1 hypothetical protein EJF17_20660 [Clavispora lusitaniae]